jgi:hypothetical protein
MRTRPLKRAETIHHDSGTCDMGTVADSGCKVFGIQGLESLI